MNNDIPLICFYKYGKYIYFILNDESYRLNHKTMKRLQREIYPPYEIITSEISRIEIAIILRYLCNKKTTEVTMHKKYEKSYDGHTNKSTTYEGTCMPKKNNIKTKKEF